MFDKLTTSITNLQAGMVDVWCSTDWLSEEDNDGKPYLDADTKLPTRFPRMTILHHICNNADD